MAVNGAQPFIDVYDTNGEPIVGAKLYVYEAGTTTPRAIYSDEDLLVSLPNPLTGANASDAAGRFPKFYMAAGTYKLRAETSASVLIWQYDDLDTGMSAGAGALPIASGGTGATTAAAARANLDVPSNSELADLADDIASVTASVQAIIGQPQGRLTPTSGVPEITTGVSAGTSVYYTPFIGAQVPIYDGVIFSIETFAELTLALHANHVANSIYDVFIWDESGTITIGTGPAWNTVTAGAGARGTGAGTTELTTVSGIKLNANSMTARNGGTTYTVGAQRGTYLGTIFMDGTNGQVSCLTAYGVDRKWGIWNAYNQRPVILLGGDTTATHTYDLATVRQADAQTDNKLIFATGLPGTRLKIEMRQNVSSASSSALPAIGIGENSTTAFSSYADLTAPGVAGASWTLRATHVAIPAIGIHNYNFLESSASVSSTFRGGIDDNLVTAEFLA